MLFQLLTVVTPGVICVNDSLDVVQNLDVSYYLLIKHIKCTDKNNHILYGQ